jgi:hypothetical protein
MMNRDNTDIAIALGIALAIARIPRPATFDDRTIAERGRCVELEAMFRHACKRAGDDGGWLAHATYINAICDRLDHPRVYA